MNPATDTDPRNDWIDAVLRADAVEQASSYLDDAGFAARVMERLPAAVQPLPRWRKPALVLMWSVAGVGAALALPGVAADLGREVFRLVAGQPVSLAQIAAAMVLIGVTTLGGAAYALKND